MTFGQRLRELRKSKNLSQEELGKVIHVSKVSISGYENDTREPGQEALKSLASYFNVTTDYLLGTNSTPKWANEKDTNDLQRFLNDNEGSMTYGGEDLTKEEKEKLKIAMTQIFWSRHKHD